MVDTIKIINMVYDEQGFEGVIEEITDRLNYGTVKSINGLIRITTGGFSDDEALLHCLIRPDCIMHKHYCGYIRGGAFYFCEEKYANIEMIKVAHYDR